MWFYINFFVINPKLNWWNVNRFVCVCVIHLCAVYFNWMMEKIDWHPWHFWALIDLSPIFILGVFSRKIVDFQCKFFVNCLLVVKYSNNIQNSVQFSHVLFISRTHTHSLTNIKGSASDDYQYKWNQSKYYQAHKLLRMKNGIDMVVGVIFIYFTVFWNSNKDLRVHSFSAVVCGVCLWVCVCSYVCDMWNCRGCSSRVYVCF